jgi:hypothetical protein
MVIFLIFIGLLIFDAYCWWIILLSKEDREKHAYKRMKVMVKSQTPGAGIQYNKREQIGLIYLYLAWGMAIVFTALILLILLGLILRLYFPNLYS